ncbi:MAG: right-handed parallel beta-helix repeat-containing protein [Kiritimatiellae bacterium]|nr:right-handed parallel beta-helix repeat-containing protein [Kiritimatiellia bacterium]
MAAMSFAALWTCQPAAGGALTRLPFDEDFGAMAGRPDPVGCVSFEIAPPRANCGAVVKAEDFGFSVTNEMNGASIQSALAEAKRIGAAKVVLKPGIYRCFDKTGIIIDGFEDFVFDGAGAELVFRRPPRYPIEPSWDHDGSGANFVIHNCRRMKIGNMVTDWDSSTMPLATCAKVAAVHVDDADNDSYIDFELVGCGERHPYYGKAFPIQRTQPMTEDFRRFARGPNIWHGTYEGETGCKTLWLSPTRVRAYPFVEEPGIMRWQGPNRREFSPKLNRDAVRSHKVGDTVRIAHAYYGKGGFTLVSNEDFELHDVEIPSCFGHAVYVGGTQRNWRLRNVTVAPRDWRHPISSSADTIHFVRSHGNAIIDNLTVKLEQDDAINVHDRFTVVKKVAPRTLQIVLERGARYFRPGAGNAVELLDPGYNAIGWEGKYAGMEGETILVDRDLPAVNPEEGYYLLFDRTASSDGVIIRNCTFEDMEMRTLVNASNATIENCIFRRTNGDALRCIADYTLKWWAEGMGTTNVVVRNCIFENNCVRELVGSY